MSSIKPLGKRVLIKRTKAKVSQGGILLPESAQEKPKQGQVIATGEGKIKDNGSLDPVTLKKGDEVLFSSYSGTEIKSENPDEELLILSEDDVLGVLN